ncbi:MAG: metal-sensitive transcriptional regulator [Patescibacteria group bacterium]|jgi:DNA-binding FrmR family transcriptional regulator
MKTSEQRINNIIGQLEGVKKMLAGGPQDCVSLIVQLKAVKSAMASLMEKIIADEFNYCLLDEKLSSQQKMEKIFKELINK